MKYKVAELEGALLDAAVSKALGEEFGANYSTSWHHGGPIIERERIRLMHEHGTEEDGDAQWYASCRSFKFNGSTPLVAAMRAYCASVFGEVVELPLILSSRIANSGKAECHLICRSMLSIKVRCKSANGPDERQARKRKKPGQPRKGPTGPVKSLYTAAQLVHDVGTMDLPRPATFSSGCIVNPVDGRAWNAEAESSNLSTQTTSRLSRSRTRS